MAQDRGGVRAVAARCAVECGLARFGREGDDDSEAAAAARRRKRGHAARLKPARAKCYRRGAWCRCYRRVRREGIVAASVEQHDGDFRAGAQPGEVIGTRVQLTKQEIDVGEHLRFAKWRAVIRIGAGLPSTACVQANAHELARYAALSQEAGLAPIIEPEVLMDGPHDVGTCAEVTERVLREVYEQLSRQRVVLEATLLKPNMVLPGTESQTPASDEEIARTTLEVLRRTVPAAVPGILFLSGGQSGWAAPLSAAPPARSFGSTLSLSAKEWPRFLSSSTALVGGPTLPF